MRKIPTLFVRDFGGDPRRVLREVSPGSDWVLAGEGVATRKLDGSCCMVRQGRLFKRRELKPGQPEPAGWEEADRDEATGKRVGWVPVGERPEDKFHREALALWAPGPIPDGTYELLGPKVQGGVEGDFPRHTLIGHSEAPSYGEVARDFEGLRAWLQGRDIEGLVFHHPDGRMAKIKKRDFGLPRRPEGGA